MNLQPVADRLKGITPRGASSAVALAALGDRPPQFFPAIFVIPDGEQAGTPRRLAGVHDQLLTVSFMVLIMVSTAAADPNRVTTELETLTNNIEERLVGWAHPDAEGQATAHAGSALLAMAGGRIEWAIKFTTQRRIRKAVQ
jgi:hypothetical protein